MKGEQGGLFGAHDGETYRGRWRESEETRKRKRKAAVKKARAKNPEKYRAWERKARAKNPEKHRAADRKARAKNPEKYRARDRKAYAKDPEKYRARDRKAYAKNPEKRRARKRKHHLENAEKNNAKSKEYHAALKNELYELVSKGHVQCACCGEADRKNLQLDHVNGDGAEDRKEYADSHNGAALTDRVYLKRLKNGTQKRPLQLLCRSCNIYKRKLPKCPCEKGRKFRAERDRRDGRNDKRSNT